MVKKVPNIFQFRKVKLHKKHIRKLKTESGEIIKHPEDIVHYQRNFYSKLLRSNKTDLDTQEANSFFYLLTYPLRS